MLSLILQLMPESVGALDIQSDANQVIARRSTPLIVQIRNP